MPKEMPQLSGDTEVVSASKASPELRFHKFKILVRILGVFVLAGIFLAGFWLGQKQSFPGCVGEPTFAPEPDYKITFDDGFIELRGGRCLIYKTELWLRSTVADPKAKAFYVPQHQLLIFDDLSGGVDVAIRIINMATEGEMAAVFGTSNFYTYALSPDKEKLLIINGYDHDSFYENWLQVYKLSCLKDFEGDNFQFDCLVDIPDEASQHFGKESLVSSLDYRSDGSIEGKDRQGNVIVVFSPDFQGVEEFAPSPEITRQAETDCSLLETLKIEDLAEIPQADCERCEGKWELLSMDLSLTGCNPQTSDAGKACTDFGQCVGVCSSQNILATSGTCSDYKYVLGCHYEFFEGELEEFCRD